MNTNVRFFLSYDIGIILKSYFWRENISKVLVVYRFECMALFHSQTRRQMIKNIEHFMIVFVAYQCSYSQDKVDNKTY